MYVIVTLELDNLIIFSPLEAKGAYVHVDLAEEVKTSHAFTEDTNFICSIFS